MPHIDPCRLLNTLSVLLNLDGGIKENEDVQRVVSLMTKFSKKLISKCIYIQILSKTSLSQLTLFYKHGGWQLLCDWLKDSVSKQNWALVELVLCLWAQHSLSPSSSQQQVEGEGVSAVGGGASGLYDVCISCLHDVVSTSNCLVVTGLARRLITDWQQKLSAAEQQKMSAAEQQKLSAAEQQKLSAAEQHTQSSAARLHTSHHTQSSHHHSSSKQSHSTAEVAPPLKSSLSKSAKRARLKSDAYDTSATYTSAAHTRTHRHGKRSSRSHRTAATHSTTPAGVGGASEAAAVSDRDRHTLDAVCGSSRLSKTTKAIPKRSSQPPTTSASQTDTTRGGGETCVSTHASGSCSPASATVRAASEVKCFTSHSRPGDQAGTGKSLEAAGTKSRQQHQFSEALTMAEKRVHVERKSSVQQRPGGAKFIPTKCLQESSGFMDALNADTTERMKRKLGNKSGSSKRVSAGAGTTSKSSQADKPAGSKRHISDSESETNVEEVKATTNSATPGSTHSMANKDASNVDYNSLKSAQNIPNSISTDTEDIKEAAAKSAVKKGLLVVHRSTSRNLHVHWPSEKQLISISYFEMDETERVNVNRAKFDEAIAMEKLRERDLLRRQRLSAPPGGAGSTDSMCEQMEWSRDLLFVVERGALLAEVGCKSKEALVQKARELEVMSYNSSSTIVTDTPGEASFERLDQSQQTRAIPLDDDQQAGGATVKDFSAQGWPDPQLPFMGTSRNAPYSRNAVSSRSFSHPRNQNEIWIQGKQSVPGANLSNNSGPMAVPPHPQNTVAVYATPSEAQTPLSGVHAQFSAPFSGAAAARTDWVPGLPNPLPPGMRAPALMPTMMGPVRGPRLPSTHIPPHMIPGAHPLAGRLPLRPMMLPPGGSKENRVPCKHFKAGYCRNGFNCLYLHVTPNNMIVPGAYAGVRPMMARGGSHT